jgi:hypothetical protein
MGTPIRSLHQTTSNGYGDSATVASQGPSRSHRSHGCRVNRDARVTDRWIYRMVVAALGLTVIISLVGGIILAIISKNIPEGLLALGSAAIGALAGLLAPAPHS